MGGIVDRRRMGKSDTNKQCKAQQGGKGRLHHLCGGNLYNSRIISHFRLRHALYLPNFKPAASNLNDPCWMGHLTTSENTYAARKYNS